MSTPQVVQWRTDEEGMRVALVVARGRRLLQIIPIDSRGIKIEKVPLSQERWITPLVKRSGRPYPLKATARRLLRLHKTFGGTRSAKRALKEIVDG